MPWPPGQVRTTWSTAEALRWSSPRICSRVSNMAIRVRQSDVVRFRIERLFWFVTICYLLLVARLVYLQAIKGEYFRTKARTMRSQVIAQPAQRGAILDSDGKPLAVTIHASQVACDPTKIKDPVRTAAISAEVLGVKPEEI